MKRHAVLSASFLCLLLLSLLVMLPALSLAEDSSATMGSTVIGDPWWKYEPGETVEGKSGILYMVQVENLMVPVPTDGWYADPVPEELEEPDRKLFLLHRETGAYFSVSYTETDSKLTARMMYQQMVDEGSDLLPQLIRTPSRVDTLYTVGYHIPAHCYTLFDSQGGMYIIETVYTAQAYDLEDISSRISACNYDIVHLLYLIEE